MANIGSLTATLGVDTRALAKAERTFRGVMGRMKNEVFSLKGALIALSGAFALHELKKGILDVTHLAGRYVELGIAMKTAGENAGFSADQMLAFQKSVESMGIAAIEARQTLLRMSVAGIDLSRSMELARAAQDLAVVGAINSSEAFERLIYGIQKGNKTLYWYSNKMIIYSSGKQPQKIKWHEKLRLLFIPKQHIWESDLTHHCSLTEPPTTMRDIYWRITYKTLRGKSFILEIEAPKLAMRGVSTCYLAPNKRER